MLFFLFWPKGKVSDWRKQIGLYKGIPNQIPMYQGKTRDAETEEYKLLYEILTSSHYSPKMCLSLAVDSKEIKSSGMG